MKDNPMMQHYAAVYASSMGVMLLFKLIRGIAFVKVRTSHTIPTRKIPSNLLTCHMTMPLETVFSAL